jgi:hypothetical protein
MGLALYILCAVDPNVVIWHMAVYYPDVYCPNASPFSQDEKERCRQEELEPVFKLVLPLQKKRFILPGTSGSRL